MGESLRRSGVLMTVSLSGVCAVLLDFNAEGTAVCRRFVAIIRTSAVGRNLDVKML